MPEHGDPGHAHGPDDHDHGRHHSHDHRSIGRRRLLIVLLLTATFMVVEFVGGWIANSLALMADAAHMLSDVGALGLSVFALWFAQRPATREKSYGYLRIEILAALANGITLVVIAMGIFWQAYRRFLDPEPVEGGLMLGIAAGGLAVNVIAALVLHTSANHNLNVRGAYLHVLGDLLGSAGAILAAVIILTTGWITADPLISCLVAVLILVSSWRLIRESVDVLLEAVPAHIDLDRVRRAIVTIPGVDAVHDLHIWTLSSGYLAMSGHALVEDPKDYKQIIERIHTRMHDEFGISHVTIQVEHRTMYSIERRERRV